MSAKRSKDPPEPPPLVRQTTAEQWIKDALPRGMETSSKAQKALLSALNEKIREVILEQTDGGAGPVYRGLGDAPSTSQPAAAAARPRRQAAAAAAAAIEEEVEAAEVAAQIPYADVKRLFGPIIEELAKEGKKEITFEDILARCQADETADQEEGKSAGKKRKK